MASKIFFKLFLVVLLLLVLLVGCTPQDCCQECLERANQDPSGYDISIKPCSEYGLDCKYSVGECENTPPLETV